MKWTRYCTAGIEAEPDSDGGNDSSSACECFSGTIERDCRVSNKFSSEEDGDGTRWGEQRSTALGGERSYQRPSLSSTKMETIPKIIIDI